MIRPYLLVAYGLWVFWLVSWNIAAFWRDRRTRQASRGSYGGLLVIAGLGMVVTFFQPSPQLEGHWWLRPLWTTGAPEGVALDGLVALSIAFAWWARIHLGRLWSGGIERTEDHRVVDTGPYRLVRHPIYTGLIFGALAVALIKAIPVCFVGVALVALGFGLKARVEERFLEKEIGGYDAYRRRVAMLVPGLRPGRPETA